MSVSVRGLGRTLSRIRRLPRAANEARDEVLREWAEDTQDAAERRAPVRTGDLWGSIDSRVFRDAAYVGVWEPEELEYAEYVEKGTSSMEAQPYLRPAFELTKRDVPRKLRAEVRRRLDGGA